MNNSPTSNNIIDVKNVSRRFGGLVAVDEASLHVSRGSITGLIGPNGAGKSTMFSLIAGSLSPTSGEVWIDGMPGHHKLAHRRIGMGLGRTFQIPRPFPEMTVLENVMVAFPKQAGEALLPNWLQWRRVAREERENLDKARDLLDFVALLKLADQPARVLSGGQRKLLELARALAADPKVILLDEPAAGVNPSLLETIIARIRELNEQGMSFLLIEHNMDMVTRLCDRVFAMSRGQMLCSGTPGEVTSDPRLLEAYLGGASC
ncbi:ABC transporter ATP-binding protein (plasmid) [Burkholderia sp. SFA1]|uniref:ABC transporter ATP-binding protein n=1 Tax=unclassified Caballeronia TaxID=2646786 RepID=UPI001F287A16|nr:MULTISPECIES: ABC transporter ATP-binding protein [unclassified Caballeronia]MCE4548178.1 ABC transporter ATP-binding protein [Caballeronia sp. PC1]MCE4575843.1 ABC transporter ATP-binding protein [Caballeronia sp. CLC5]BBQ02497.1 ABC transporter ATP-binding protein [Burkholderia sp. SFA1]